MPFSYMGDPPSGQNNDHQHSLSTPTPTTPAAQAAAPASSLGHALINPHGIFAAHQSSTAFLPGDNVKYYPYTTNSAATAAALPLGLSLSSPAQLPLATGMTTAAATTAGNEKPTASNDVNTLFQLQHCLYDVQQSCTTTDYDTWPSQTNMNVNAGPFEYLQQPSSRSAPLTKPVLSIDVPEPSSSAARMIHDNDVTNTDIAAPASMHLFNDPEPSAGLPCYSQSGFDMLTLLGRVANRPNPRIALGPVDLSCAFVVSDARADDAPIIHVSRTFCELTGYSEHEVLGRNCRFLQAPGGQVRRGDRRTLTSTDAVGELKYALAADREVQVSLVNYRRDGSPFVNRVSVIPIPALDDSNAVSNSATAYYVGFQVDMNEQPTTIAARMRDGKYFSPNSTLAAFPAMSPAERSAKRVGPTLKQVLADSRFHSTVALNTACHHPGTALEVAPSSISTSTPTSTSTPIVPVSAATPSNGNVSALRPDARDAHQWLHLLLLEHAPDVVHVLSLKGLFLYASPAAARVLGYSPQELVGKNVSDLVHPSDAVPLLRELKESSGGGGGGGGGGTATAVGKNTSAVMGADEPRTVDLLFRMQTRTGGFAWIECDGRLHTETGKGRKAVVLAGRRRTPPGILNWREVDAAGGLLDAVRASTTVSGRKAARRKTKDWQLSRDNVEAEGEGNGENGDGRYMDLSFDDQRTLPAHFEDGYSNDGDVDEDLDEDGQKSRNNYNTVDSTEREREFWAVLSPEALFLVVSVGVRDVLGAGAGEILGRALVDFVLPVASRVHGDASGRGGGDEDQAVVRDVCEALRENETRALRAAGLRSPSSGERVDDENKNGQLNAGWRQRKFGLWMRRRNADTPVFVELILYASVTGVRGPGSQRDPSRYSRAESLDEDFSLNHDDPGSPYIKDEGMYVDAALVGRQVVAQFKVLDDAASSVPESTSTTYGYEQDRGSASDQVLNTSTKQSRARANENVFSELEPGAGTSWQYELQQLKLVNQRLRKELADREEARRHRGR